MTRESPPFPLGTTLYEGDATLITEAGLAHLKGMEWTFRDNDEDGGGSVAGSRSGRDRVFRVVKNDHSAAVLPKIGVKLDTYGQEASGLFAEGPSGFDHGIVDEHLPTAGCAVGDLFWAQLRGPCVCIADADAVDIVDGDMVVMATNGHVRKFDPAELDLDLYAELNSRVGRSIHGSTVSTDGAEIVINLMFGG